MEVIDKAVWKEWKDKNKNEYGKMIYVLCQEHENGGFANREKKIEVDVEKILKELGF